MLLGKQNPDQMLVFTPEVRRPGDWIVGVYRQHGGHGGLRHPPGAQHQGQDQPGHQHQHGRLGAASGCRIHRKISQD